MSSQPQPYAVPSWRHSLATLALLAVLYLWVFPYQAHVNNPNENVRVFMTVATVDDGTFAINRIERDWGYVNDKSLRQTPVEELLRRRISPAFLQVVLPPDVFDRYRRAALTPADRALTVPMLYSSKAPATSLLGVPAYWLLTKVTGRSSIATPPAISAAPNGRPTPARPPLDRTLIVYVLRLCTTVLPALVFAVVWQRFLGRYTRSALVRDAAVFATMTGSLLFAYSEVFSSHAQNAFCAAGAFMALAVARERDEVARRVGAKSPGSYGLFLVAGALGVAVTCFEYPSAMVTLAIGLLVLSSVTERRGALAVAFGALFVLGGKLALDGHLKIGAALFALALVSYALTLTGRSLARLVSAGVGALLPLAPTLWFHKRAFGSPFKTGYSFIENPVFHQEHSQGFFGATEFNWESATRLWADPSFGMITGTPLLLMALPGFAAWVAPRGVEGDRAGAFVRWVVRGFSLVGIAVSAVKLAKVLLLLRGVNGGWPPAVLQGFFHLGHLLGFALALLVASMPAPKRRDAGVGAAALLAVFLLTRLIGMMNNWRGGWTVGPRYLATLVPLLIWASVMGLEALREKGSFSKRAVTVFAAASTLAAMALTGIASVWFPHVPTDFVSPLFELFVPLLRGGFAPRNAGQQFFHLEGLVGMAPFFVAAAFVVLRLAKGDERRPVAVLAHATGVFALVCALLLPFALVARYETVGTTRWAMTMWEPARTRPTPASVANVPQGETPEATRARARALVNANDGPGALEAYRRAALAERPASAPRP